MSKLMECKTCGGKVSANATSCPHCGEDGTVKLTFFQRLKRAVIWAIVFMVGLGFLINYIGSSIDENKSESNKYQAIIDENNRKMAALDRKEAQLKKQRQEENKKILAPKKDKFIELVKKEKKVFGVTWESEDFLTFGMINDGTNRDGFAQYICVLKNEAGLEGHRIFVKIYDAKLMMNSGEAKVIGKTTCN